MNALAMPVLLDVSEEIELMVHLSSHNILSFAVTLSAWLQDVFVQLENSSLLGFLLPHQKRILHFYSFHRKLKHSLQRNISSYPFSFFLKKKNCIAPNNIAVDCKENQNFSSLHRCTQSKQYSHLLCLFFCCLILGWYSWSCSVGSSICRLKKFPTPNNW